MERFTFFWESDSPFSQWYPVNFIVKNIKFNCAEQYMMYMKAKVFADDENSKKILTVKSPSKQKAIGRKVKNFNPVIWSGSCKKIVYEGNYAKFTQNEDILKMLLDTKGTTLVEASPVDMIWGVGFAADDPRIQNRKNWLGKNWLGETLTQLRDNILKEKN